VVRAGEGPPAAVLVTAFVVGVAAAVVALAGVAPAPALSLAGAIAFPFLAGAVAALSVDAKTGASGSGLLGRRAPIPIRKVTATPMTTTKKR